MVGFTLMLLVMLLTGCIVSAPPTAPAGGETGAAVAVIDGDTIDVSLNGQTYRVRYIGVNTPERDQPCYAEAVEANRALVENQTVTLVRDVSETDQYGRLLRYVYVGDTFINAEMVRSGYAEASTFPPDVRFSADLVQLAQEAREAGRGCWSTDVWNPPSGASCDCSGNRYDCADFTTRADAQACFDQCVAQGAGDVHRLDTDADGAVCETLP